MPSPDTFSIRPISDLLDKWLADRTCIVDPFSRNSKRAHWRNDLNPSTEAESHKDAEEFLRELYDQNIHADCILFDPPYSPRQISEVYKSIGREVGMKETQNAALYKRVKDAANRIAGPGTIAICCGWNTASMGNEWQTVEIMAVCHGGAHNDTLVTVQVKTHEQGRLA